MAKRKQPIQGAHSNTAPTLTVVSEGYALPNIKSYKGLNLLRRPSFKAFIKDCPWYNVSETIATGVPSSNDKYPLWIHLHSHYLI